MNDKVCYFCRKPLGAAVVTTGNMEFPYCHSWCYESRQPMYQANHLEDVLSNGHDQVLARQVVVALVPQIVASKIVREFNEQYKVRHARRMEMYKDEYRHATGEEPEEPK